MLPLEDEENLPDDDEQIKLKTKMTTLYNAIKDSKFKCSLMTPMLNL